jgi:hypothetical protein
MIAVIEPKRLRDLLAQDLGLSVDESTETILAQALRRLCAILCPCPREQLTTWGARSLSFLSKCDGVIDLEQALDETIEALLIAGDVLEARPPSGNGQGPLVYPCAPSFMHVGDRTYLLGVAEDDALHLPRLTRKHLMFEGATRFLTDNTLSSHLEAAGLQCISPSHWARKLPINSADHYRQALERQLVDEGRPGDLGAVKILAHATAHPVSYRARWKDPQSEYGLHIFRVPRLYGSPAWYIGDFRDGHIDTYAPIPLLEAGGRACDAAWLAQLAIDATQGRPNRYFKEQGAQGLLLRLEFPIPLMIHRRLGLLSGRIQYDIGPQMPIWLPLEIAPQAEELLQHACWLAPACA